MVKKIILVLGSIYAAFLAGFGASYILNKYTPPVVPLSHSPITSSTTPSKSLDLTDFDIMLATPTDPKLLVEINHITNNAEGYAQAQVAYSLDGSSLATQLIPLESVSVSQINTNRNNREYSVVGDFTLKGKKVTFEIPSINLSMVVRAQPAVGKFGGSTANPTAKLTIEGKESAAYAAMTAGFFNKYVPVDVEKQKVMTHWLMFWDENWNFYHLDLTTMDFASADYYPHTFYSKVSGGNLVTYFDAVDSATFVDNKFILDSVLGNTTLQQNFILGSRVMPYQHATMYLTTSNKGGTGLYMAIDYTK